MMDATPHSAHRRTWDLIPWVVNGSASDAERRDVEQHTAACSDCAEELAFQRQLHAAMTASTPPAHGPAPALDRFWERVDREEAAAPAATSPLRPAQATPLPAAPHRPARTRWLVAAVVLQGIGLVALSGVLWERPAAYETLSRPAAPSVATIRLVPAPSLSMAELRQLLVRSGVQIADSSADGGILGLVARPGETDAPQALVARLRAEPGVLLAEPIGTAPVRR